MRLIGFSSDGTRHIGRLTGATVEDLGSADDFFTDPFESAFRDPFDIHPRADIAAEPALPVTGRIFCVGINYHSHAGESKDLAGIDLPKVPMVFGRWQQSLVTNGVPAPVPVNEEGLDWEVELSVVIGRAYNIYSDVDPQSIIFGYAAFNDLSARRKQLETPQFTLGKNADRSGPISEVITADEVGDISAGLRVTTHVNGKLMQEGNTRDLIHDIPTIIDYIADTVTLLPGDVIATGTPGGVGAGMSPPVFLVAGDQVEVNVERVGAVRTPIV